MLHLWEEVGLVSKEHWRPTDVHTAVQNGLSAVGDFVNRAHRARNLLMGALLRNPKPEVRERILSAMELLGEDPEMVEEERNRDLS